METSKLVTYIIVFVIAVGILASMEAEKKMASAATISGTGAGTIVNARYEPGTSGPVK